MAKMRPLLFCKSDKMPSGNPPRIWCPHTIGCAGPILPKLLHVPGAHAHETIVITTDLCRTTKTTSFHALRTLCLSLNIDKDLRISEYGSWNPNALFLQSYTSKFQQALCCAPLNERLFCLLSSWWHILTLSVVIKEQSQFLKMKGYKLFANKSPSEKTTQRPSSLSGPRA